MHGLPAEDIPRRRLSEASVHGRFQVFHNGHLEYVCEAKLRCDFLWIGITQYDIRQLKVDGVSAHRSVMGQNPLTYFERIVMIAEVLVEHGIDRAEFGFVPFPIEEPELLPDFLPIAIPCLTTIYDEWNRDKVRRLEAVGYQVTVLWEGTKKPAEGRDLRRLIESGNEAWKALVPAATVKTVERLNLGQRLRSLSEH